MADAIDSSNQLVRTLSDPGRPVAVKEQTVRALFGGRVGPRALELALEVVRRRWSEQEDILDALESLGVSAAAPAGACRGRARAGRVGAVRGRAHDRWQR
ncbi:hypothetical protein [Brachybacterium sp. GPGPB12]|uniref:hypothetical protein n=1 Tax=Brachybacterium sp. GPGPB12 TaxID=3023517 RepID=UPI0031344EA3